MTLEKRKGYTLISKIRTFEKACKTKSKRQGILGKKMRCVATIVETYQSKRAPIREIIIKNRCKNLVLIDHPNRIEICKDCKLEHERFVWRRANEKRNKKKKKSLQNRLKRSI